MYQAQATSKFDRQFKKSTRRNQGLKRLVYNTIEQLSANPLSISLQTHKVRIGGVDFWSSRVSGNIRIIWQFEKRYSQVIDLISLGGHSGKNKVYK